MGQPRGRVVVLPGWQRLRICIAAAVAMLATSCGVVTPTMPPPRAQGELLVVGPWEILSLDPLGSGAQFMRMQVTETLVDAANDGTVLPGLAVRWSTSSDGLEWRFALPLGTRFHDGSALTAASVLPSLERARVEPGSLALAPVERLEAKGNDLIVRLSRPFAPLAALLAHASTQILAPSSFGPSGEVQSIIGTGPYRIESIKRPQTFTVVVLKAGGASPRRFGARGISPSVEPKRAR